MSDNAEIWTSGMPAPEGWSQSPGAPAPLTTSFALTAQDKLPVFGGQVLGQVPSAELTRWFLQVGVSGVSHEQGRAQNAEAYGRHIEKIAKVAGDKAVSEWLNQQQVSHG
jgi:hypothetical protein